MRDTPVPSGFDAEFVLAAPNVLYERVTRARAERSRLSPRIGRGRV